MHTREEQLNAFNRALSILDELREKCPWDRKQTMESLRQNTIEEVFELGEAIIKEDMSNINKELGDVLLHVLFYAKIADEKGQFDIADVCNNLCDKLIFRHPHVYPPSDTKEGDEVIAENAEAVSKLWERVKLKEKEGNKSVLGGIPNSLPSLIKAFRIQEKVANVGFDWEQREDVWDKVKEEIQEFEKAIRKNGENTFRGEYNTDQMEEELGDILFSIINMARLYKLKPDNALEKTNKKFIKRFEYIEQQLRYAHISFNDATREQLEAWWNDAKQFD